MREHARAEQHRMTGSRVPLHRAAKPGIEVGLTPAHGVGVTDGRLDRAAVVGDEPPDVLGGPAPLDALEHPRLVAGPLLQVG